MSAYIAFADDAATLPAATAGYHNLAATAAGMWSVDSAGLAQLLNTGKINAQTGATYTALAADAHKLVTFSNSSAIAVTLPQATTAGFGSGFWYACQVLGAGTVTITPTTSTINGAATLVLRQGQGAIIFSDGTNYSAMLGGAPVGGILQAQSVTKTDTFSTNSTSFTAVTGLTVNITPVNAASKIIVIASVHGNAAAQSRMRLVRTIGGSPTYIAIGDAAGSRSQASGGTFYNSAAQVVTANGAATIDSPATTSAITYSIEVAVQSGFTVYINRGTTDTDSADFTRVSSGIIVMELAQ